MSLINDFLEKITGLDLDGSSEPVVNHPCSNCPSNCAIAGEACALCEPYKKKLIDAVYHVEHIDEFRAQYEVVGKEQIAASEGTVTCPYCGGPSSSHYVCDYCGAKLSDKPVSSEKIQVAAASDIPNPIMQAQDIIYERYDAIVSKYAEQKTSSDSFLSKLFSELLSSGSDDDSGSILGTKMSEAEIKEAAGLYGVSVGDYLTGLDNGKYLNLTAKKEADQQGRASWSPSAAGMAGMAGIGMVASGLINSGSGRRRPQDDLQRPSQWDSQPRQPQIREPRPSQNRPRPQQESRPEERVRPSSSQSSRRRPEEPSRERPSQRSQPSSSDRWKERDPSRRRG